MKYACRDWGYPLDAYQNSIFIILFLRLFVFLAVQRAEEPDVSANENIGLDKADGAVPGRSVSPSSNSQLPALAPSTLTMADYASTLASLRMVSVSPVSSFPFPLAFPILSDYFWWIWQIFSFMYTWEPMDLNKWFKLQALLLALEQSSVLSRLCKISGFVFASCSVELSLHVLYHLLIFAIDVWIETLLRFYKGLPPLKLVFECDLHY